MKKIKVRCKGSCEFSLDELTILQEGDGYKLKELSKANAEKLERQIVKKGFWFPFFVWHHKKEKCWYYTDGTQRHKVIRMMEDSGKYQLPEKYPCIEIEAKDKTEAAEAILSQSASYGEITEDGLKGFLDDNNINLSDIKHDLEFAGIDLDQIDMKWQQEDQEFNTDADDVPDPPEEPISKRGDLWILGEHRLLCGDCTDADDVARVMGGEKADIVLTDPPYNCASESRNHASDVSKSMNDLKNSEWDKGFSPEISLSHLKGVVSKNASIYIWTSHYLFRQILDCLKWCDFTNYLVWNKPNPMPSLSKRHPTWNTELCVYGTVGSKRTVNFPKDGHFPSCRTVVKKSDGTHPTQKPVELISPLIGFSSFVQATIYDPFSGSGTTIIAAEQLSRRCFAIEIEPIYVDVSVLRWENYTGLKAELCTG